MERYLQNRGKVALLWGALAAQSCGLGAAGTTAQNNATMVAASPTSTVTPSAPAESGTNAPPSQTTDAGDTATTGETAVAPAPSPVSPSPTTSPSPNNGNTVASSPNTTSSDLFTISALRYSFFDHNQANGAFVLVLTDDAKFCQHRPLGLAVANSHELKISATLSQTTAGMGNTQASSDKSLTAILTQLGPQCQVAEEAQLQSGTFNVSSYSTNAAEGNFSFQMATAGSAPHAVAGTFTATACAGLRGGVPQIVACM